MASAWTEHRSPTGRLYWYNSATSTSSWERPDDLKTPAERALASTPWKEYQTAEGRKYWHHTQTKETTWTLPDEVRLAVEKAAASAPETTAAPPAIPAPAPVQRPPNSVPMHPTFVPAAKTPVVTPGATSTPASGQSTPARPPQSSMAPSGNTPTSFTPPAASLPARPLTSILHSAPAPNPVPIPMPDFKTPEEAERAFIGLLRVKGVNPSWTWEQTMRDIITEPLYKALDTLAARKAAWEKFIDGERKREKENREKNIARVRGGWKAGLDALGTEKTIVNHSGVQTKLPAAPPRLWWTYERLKSELERRAPDVWKLCRDDEERKFLWEEYLSELRQRDLSLANQLRGRQQEKLTNLLRAHEDKLGLPGPLETIQWRHAQEAILQSEDFQQDEDLRKMDDLDMLIVFEEEVKRAEKEAAELKAKAKDEKRRSCRKTRAAYIQLLHELKLAGEIQAGTMWKEVYPLLEEDERYQNLLGLLGSSPLDLFWDVVDDLTVEAEEKQSIVEDMLADLRKEVTETTDFSEFNAWLLPKLESHKLDHQSLKQVFMMLQDRAVRVAKDEKRRAEKRLRNQVEDLRYALKKLAPPTEIDTPYEQALPRFIELPEFKVLEGHEDGRREAYGRYMERLKEKAGLEDKRSRKKEEDFHRSELKKKGASQLSDEEGSVMSGSKRRRKDAIDDDLHRHPSPRSARVDDGSLSPPGRGEFRDDRGHDRSRDGERSRGRDRGDHDRKTHRTSMSEREVDDDPRYGPDKSPASRDRQHNPDKSKTRVRDRSREDDHEKSRARDHRDRVRERGDERDRSGARTSVDGRDRRRKDYELERHATRHHRSSRRDRDHDDRDDDRHHSSRHEDEERHLGEKRSSGRDDHDYSDKCLLSKDRSLSRAVEEVGNGEPELKRAKTEPSKVDKLTEKSDGEEGELEG